ncbi:MAG: four helix bundle protein [Bacteroidia bacterium]
MELYKLTKKFPQDEKYELSSQVRRSSRSVCSSFPEKYIRNNEK